MAKKRVHELAKELNVSNKELIGFLNSKGYEIKSHMSSVPEKSMDDIVKHFKGEKPEPKKEGAKKTPSRKKTKEKTVKEEAKKDTKPVKKEKKQ